MCNTRSSEDFHRKIVHGFVITEFIKSSSSTKKMGCPTHSHGWNPTRQKTRDVMSIARRSLCIGHGSRLCVATYFFWMETWKDLWEFFLGAALLFGSHSIELKAPWKRNNSHSCLPRKVVEITFASEFGLCLGAVRIWVDLDTQCPVLPDDCVASSLAITLLCWPPDCDLPAFMSTTVRMCGFRLILTWTTLLMVIIIH